MPERHSNELLYSPDTMILMRCDRNRHLVFNDKNNPYRGPPLHEMVFTCAYDFTQRLGSYWKSETVDIKSWIPSCEPLSTWDALGSTDCYPSKYPDGIRVIPQKAPASGGAAFKIGDVITLQCSISSHVLIPEGTERRRCLVGGRWEFEDRGVPICTKMAGCDLPKVPDTVISTIDRSTCEMVNGEEFCENEMKQFRLNVAVDFRCVNDNEFIVAGVSRIVCTQLADKISWVPAMPRRYGCREKSPCEAPTVPAHSYFSVVGYNTVTDFPSGTMIAFECVGGYRLIGPKQLQCKQNGDWSSLSPVCVEEEDDGRGVYAGLGVLFVVGLIGIIVSLLLVKRQTTRKEEIASEIRQMNTYTKERENKSDLSLTQQASLIHEVAQRARDGKAITTGWSGNELTLASFWDEPLESKRDRKSKENGNLKLLRRLLPFKSQRTSSLYGDQELPLTNHHSDSQLDDLYAHLVPVATYISADSSCLKDSGGVLSDRPKAGDSSNDDH